MRRSLLLLGIYGSTLKNRSITFKIHFRQLDTTVEEEEDTETSQQSAEISPLRKIEQNISELLERRDIEVVEGDKFILNGVENLSKDRKGKKKAPSKPVRESKIADRHKMHDLQKSSSNNEIQKTEDYYRQLLIEGKQLVYGTSN